MQFSFLSLELPQRKDSEKFMSEILQARADVIKRLNVMVRRIDGITSFILTGSRRCPPSDIHVVVGTSDKSAIYKIYSDINFLISEFLSPKTFNYMETDGRIIKNYSFESGVGAEVTICGEDNFPSADWWTPYLDKNGAAVAFYGSASKRSSDPVQDSIQDSINDFQDDFSDDFDDDFDDVLQNNEPVSQAIEKQPVKSVSIEYAEATADGKTVGENFDNFTVDEKSGESELTLEPKQSSDEIWEHIYGRISLAKRAIAGGSVIYAGEIINELRTQLIKLICEQSGINEDYVHSIDLLSNDYQKALFKTYPAKPESGTMISALAAELSLFEQLIK